MNNCCSINYEDDRDYDYIIERLNHIEEEIQFIKKTLEHKRVKEEAWEQLKQEAEYEKIKKVNEDACTCDCDDDIEEDINPEIKKLIEQVLDAIDEKTKADKTTSLTYKWPYYKKIYSTWPYYTWLH